MIFKDFHFLTVIITLSTLQLAFNNCGAGFSEGAFQSMESAAQNFDSIHETDTLTPSTNENNKAPADTTPLPIVNESSFYLKKVTHLEGQDSQPKQARPGYLQTVKGSIAGTQITRVTPNQSFGLHNYSKRQAWNANESRLFIGSKILDASNYSVLHTTPTTSESVWSTTNPNILYGVSGKDGRSFVSYNVSTRKIITINSLSNYKSCTIGDWEGSQSDNNRYVVLTCKNSSNQKYLVSLDIVNKTILGQVKAETDFNWTSVSRSGKYIIVENNKPGSSYNDRKLMRYDVRFQNRITLKTGTNHGDFAYDDKGNDVYVMIAWDYISYVRLKDGVVVNLGFTNRAGDGHISCRAYKRPGWCYYSSTDQYQRIAAFKVGSTGQVESSQGSNRLERGIAQLELWGFTKSSSSTYENQAKVSVSPSGTKVIFSSNWSTNLNAHTPHPASNDEAHDYVLELDRK